MKVGRGKQIEKREGEREYSLETLNHILPLYSQAFELREPVNSVCEGGLFQELCLCCFELASTTRRQGGVLANTEASE